MMPSLIIATYDDFKKNGYSILKCIPQKFVYLAPGLNCPSPEQCSMFWNLFILLKDKRNAI